MKNELKILIVEDVISDADLLRYEIRKNGLHFVDQLVETKEEFISSLRSFNPDIILSDYSLPAFNGLDALKIRKEIAPLIPFILVTGSINEETAVEVMKAGSDDYIIKGNLTRIGSAIKTAIDNKAITKARYIAEEKLRESEEKQRLILENINEIVYSTKRLSPDSTEMKVDFVSNRANGIIGVSPEEIYENPAIWYEMVHHDDLPFVKKHADKVLKSGKASGNQFRIFNKNTGHYVWLEEFVVPAFDKENKNVIGTFGVGRDITERKIAEESLKESEERYRAVAESANDAIVTIKNNGKIIAWNRSAQKIFGYSESEMLDNDLEVIIPHKYVNQHDRGIQRLNPDARNRLIGKTVELIGINKNGSEFPLELSLAKWVTSSGTYFTGIIRDITTRKLAQQALIESEEKYKTMVNASPDGILITDLKGVITDISNKCLELFASENKHEVVGKYLYRFVAVEEKKTFRNLIDNTRKNRNVQNIEIYLKKRNKSLFLSEISSTLIKNIDGIPISFMIIIRDITNRKKIENIQIHADRMASLGEMASGIAHEINQPLNTISLSMDNILFDAFRNESVDNNKYLKDKSDKIFENISRIRNIIDHVRAFSRNQDDYFMTDFDVNTSINNAVSMVSEQFKHHAIDLFLYLDKGLPLVAGNTYKFEQVILNLLSNARDAVMEKSNTQAENFKMLVEIKTYISAKMLIVDIIDNGVGIKEEHIDQILLPFYTTKDTGKGTGLGLSISYQIIKEMNGTIEIINNKNNGSIFRIVIKLKNSN